MKINYQLRKGVNLVHEREDFYLLSGIPLIVIKVNEALYNILFEMRRQNGLPFSPETHHRLIGLLNKLVVKGMLVKDEIFEMQMYPSVSITIPVKNRADDIRECLVSLQSLDYSEDKVEIIVIDDGSTDSTPQVIEDFKIKAIQMTQSIGASACRNLGAKEAKGDLIAFTDSDCIPHPRWLKELVPYFNDSAIGIVGGHVSNFYSHSLIDRYEEVKSPLNMGSNPVATGGDTPTNFYVPSCNLIVRKKVFFEADGFQEDMHVGEDVDLCWRVTKLGYRLLYVPQGEIMHKHRNHILPMLKRRFDYGTSEAILYLRHKDKRKILYLPVLYSIFYVSICLGIITHYPLLFVFGVGALLIDFYRKFVRIKKIRTGGSKVFLSVVRSYFSFSYLISSYMVRYYLIFLIPGAILYPNLWVFLALLLIFSAWVDFSVKEPHIIFFNFLFFYTLEQLAYQTGVFLSCVSKKTFMPYVPLRRC